MDKRRNNNHRGNFNRNNQYRDNQYQGNQYRENSWDDNQGRENNNRENFNRDEVFSTKIKAGKRTYFFDVKATRGQDFYITITESKRRFNGDGYEKHKIFLYKEDFNKFLLMLQETINHVKTELLPDFDYEGYDGPENNNEDYLMAADNDGSYSEEQPREEDRSWDS